MNIIDANRGHFAWGLAKDSEFVGLFNYWLMKIEQSGIMAKIRANHIDNGITTRLVFLLLSFKYNVDFK